MAVRQMSSFSGIYFERAFRLSILPRSREFLPFLFGLWSKFYFQRVMTRFDLSTILNIVRARLDFSTSRGEYLDQRLALFRENNTTGI